MVVGEEAGGRRSRKKHVLSWSDWLLGSVGELTESKKKRLMRVWEWTKTVERLDRCDFNVSTRGQHAGAWTSCRPRGPVEPAWRVVAVLLTGSQAVRASLHPL